MRLLPTGPEVQTLRHYGLYPECLRFRNWMAMTARAAYLEARAALDREPDPEVELLPGVVILFSQSRRLNELLDGSLYLRSSDRRLALRMIARVVLHLEWPYISKP